MSMRDAIGGVAMSIPLGGDGRKKLSRARRASLLSIAAILGLGLAAGLGGTLGARADTVNSQDFCLQGDVSAPGNPAAVTCLSGQKDWTDFFGPTGNALALPKGTSGTFVDSTFQSDTPPDATTYASGSKDTLPIHTGWQCSYAPNDVGAAKTDLDNTYAAVERLTSDNHVILYYGAEIASANGDHNQGMWLLQDKTAGCSATPKGGTLPFTGSHTNGDLLFAVQLTGGGTKPFSASTVAFMWECTNDPVTGVCATSTPGSLVALNGGKSIGSTCNSPTTGVDEACAITNESWNVQTPWPPHNTTSTVLGPQQFFEGGIDLNEVFQGTAPCFNRFITNTRSSQSQTATLFDYTQANLTTCVTPTVNTQPYVEVGSSPNQPGCTLNTGCDTQVTSSGVPVGSSVYDTATLSGAVGTPGGTMTYKFWSDGDCGVSESNSGASAGGGSLVSGVPPRSSVEGPLVAGSYSFQATYSGDTSSGGSNNGNVGPCEPVTVNQAAPTLDTCAGTPSGANCTLLVTSGTVGQTTAVKDTAILTGASSPTGSATFQLVGPSSGSTPTFVCGSAQSLYTNSTETLPVGGETSVTGSTWSSAQSNTGTLYFTPSSIGTYYWEAKWTGDSNNAAPNSGNYVGCSATGGGESNESVTISKATPKLITVPFIGDVGTISGGDNPTGTLTFYLFADLPATTTMCQPTAQVYASPAITLSGLKASTYADLANAAALAASSLSDGMVYNWKVTYSGDSNNNGFTVGCGSSTGASGSTSTESTGTTVVK